MPRTKGIGSFHKSGIGNNQGRQRTTPRNKRWFNCKDSHSNINELSSLVISVSPPLNNSVISPPQMSSVCQQPYRSSHFSPRDNWWFNIKYSNSKRNYFSSQVIPVTPPLNNSVINPPQMSSILQKTSRSSHNTTHELQASSIPSRNSPDP